MKVEVLFKSHRYEEFDTSPQTCSEPYRGKGLAVLMDWNLYLGDLEGRGVVLAVFDYLANAHPDWSADEVARSMGYTEAAVERIRSAEIAQEDVLDDDGLPEDDGAEEDAGGGDPTGGYDFS